MMACFLFFHEVDIKDCPNITFFSVALFSVKLLVGKNKSFSIRGISIMIFFFILLVTSFYCKVKFYENHGNHSSINMDFISLLTWSGVIGL